MNLIKLAAIPAIFIMFASTAFAACGLAGTTKTSVGHTGEKYTYVFAEDMSSVAVNGQAYALKTSGKYLLYKADGTTMKFDCKHPDRAYVTNSYVQNKRIKLSAN